MYIERDLSISKISDFKKNVQTKLNDNLVVEEVYDLNMKSLCIGWIIKDLR